MNDILMTAFSVFYFQSPSWLTFQRVMETNSKTSFVCKPSSHVTLSAFISMIENLGNMDVVSQIKKSVSNKPNYYTYRFVNNIPLSNEKSAPIVNWCSVNVVNEDNKSIYHNDFITDFPIDANNDAIHRGCPLFKQ
ncbi:MAG TPA: hypothetical protein PLV58_07710 [Campylobacterales bacterium]|nr:hypothetical protein [Campylobacterales bacterium]